MAYSSINQYLPDPFTNSYSVVAPLSGVIHTTVGNVLTGTAVPSSAGTLISAGQLTAPIVISNTTHTGAIGFYTQGNPAFNTSWTGPYWKLPDAQDLISAYGGTSANQLTLVSPSFMPVRQNNSNSQVRVGDVFGVPVINLSTFPQIFVPGANGTATGLGSSDTYIVIPGYGSVSYGGPVAGGSTGPLSKTAAPQLTFQISSTIGDTSTGTGSYNLF